MRVNRLRVMRADTVGCYECNVVGNFSAVPLGDRNRHSLTSIQFSGCGIDGLLKGAVEPDAFVQEAIPCAAQQTINHKRFD
jgi:hypothetical protein